MIRIETSQYTLRNSYYGNFSDGKRHGNGTFLYANGSKYEGNWKNNLKHGFVSFNLYVNVFFLRYAAMSVIVPKKLSRFFLRFLAKFSQNELKFQAFFKCDYLR